MNNNNNYPKEVGLDFKIIERTYHNIFAIVLCDCRKIRQVHVLYRISSKIGMIDARSAFNWI